MPASPTTMDKSDVIDILSRFDAESAQEQTLLKQVSKSPRRFYLTTLLVMVWAGLMLSLSPLTLVQLPDPIAWLQKIDKTVYYTFQIPSVVLVSAMLGRRYGTVTLLLYLIAGFAGLPLFANGGGIQYFSSVTVGYLLGFLLVPATIQRIVAKAYYNTGWFRGRSLWLAFAALIGVVMVHVAGIIGIGIQAIKGTISWGQAGQWILQLSGPLMVYDFCFSWIAIGMARIFRLLFWVCLY